MPRNNPTTSARLLAALPRLTPRDHTLLDLLASHQVLSTEQITKLLFTNPHTARRRLLILHRLDVLSRHARAGRNGGRSYIYSLGPVGALLRPHAATSVDGRSHPAPADDVARVARLAASPTLPRVLAANQFFVNLIATARVAPDTHLARWWSPRRTAKVFGRFGIRADGYGVWRRGARTTGFFLYLDSGQRPVDEIIYPLFGHRWLAEVGPRHLVLIHTTTTARAEALLDAVGRDCGVEVAVIVASENPGGRVWRLASERSGPYALHELPSHPGSRPTVTTDPSRAPGR